MPDTTLSLSVHALTIQDALDLLAQHACRPERWNLSNMVQAPELAPLTTFSFTYCAPARRKRRASPVTQPVENKQA
jgi:hypothetical protein